MAQEFRINSSTIEAKINQLLPSQGGQGAGIDFSASTMVIPIVDLTESAEGSNLRVDLQSALNFTGATVFDVTNTTTTVINTTGYWRITGCSSIVTSAGNKLNEIQIDDGLASKTVWAHSSKDAGVGNGTVINIDIIVFLGAGDSLKLKTNANTGNMIGSVRQLADVNGNLINP
jgi:hypothetical protein